MSASPNQQEVRDAIHAAIVQILTNEPSLFAMDILHRLQDLGLSVSTRTFGTTVSEHLQSHSAFVPDTNRMIGDAHAWRLAPIHALPPPKEQTLEQRMDHFLNLIIEARPSVYEGEEFDLWYAMLDKALIYTRNAVRRKQFQERLMASGSSPAPAAGEGDAQP